MICLACFKLLRKGCGVFFFFSFSFLFSNSIAVRWERLAFADDRTHGTAERAVRVEFVIGSVMGGLWARSQEPLRFAEVDLGWSFVSDESGGSL